MKIAVPKPWREAADEFEAQGIELSVIGRPRPSADAVEIGGGAGKIVMRLKVEVPGGLESVAFRQDALLELREAVTEILRGALARASQANRSQVTAEDVKPAPHP